MPEYEEKLWTEEECEKLCGHCWDRSNTVGYEHRRRVCRHCGRVEDHVWVKADA